MLDGKDNFKMNRDDKGIYFSAVGPLTSTARIKIYAFKNAKDQLKFYSKMEIADTGLTVEQYNSVIVELSTNSELAEVVETNITIVEAEVSDFNISRTERMDLKSNKLYTIRANSSEYSDLVLGTTILDKLNEPVPAMISKVAARILVKDGDNWVETDEVKLIGGEKTTISVNGSDRNYTFINSDIRDLANAYWEISSQSDKQIYKMEVVLLMTKTNGEETTFEIYNNKEYTFEVSFNENVEASVNWNTDETNLSMIVFSGQGQSTQYQKQLSEMINVPVNNIYQKVVYFAYSDIFTDKNTAETYFASGTIAAFDEYTFGTEEEKDWVVLSSPYLLFKKGIQGLKVRFATVKTDAYGNVLEDANKYQIIKFSTNLTIDALEKIDGWNTVEATIEDTNCNPVPLVAPEGQTKYVIDRDKEVEITIDMKEAAKANLFLAQKDKMTLQVISNNITIDSAQYTYSAPVIEDNTKIKYIITFKPTFEVGDGTTENPGKEVTFKLLYHPTDNEIHDETCEIKFPTVAEGVGNGCGFLTVYDSKPNTIQVDDLDKKYQVNIETSTGTSLIKIGDQEANEVIKGLLGENGANIKVYDGYHVEITDNSTINLTSSNSNLIEVDNVNKQVEFKNGITSQSSDVSLTISSGAASVSVNFTFTSEKVTRIQYLKDDDNNQKNDNDVNDTNSVSEETNLTSVNVKKAGFKDNDITLDKLVKVFVGDPESQDPDKKFKKYEGTLTFKLRNIAGMGDNKNYIVGGTGTSMLQLTGTDGLPLTLENITSETAIQSIKILNDFGVDYPLELRIEGVGISIDLNLIFVNNITGVVTLPTQYDRGENTVAKPADYTNANGIVYTGVFADYEIPLGGNVKKVYIKDQIGSIAIDWENTASTDSENITINTTSNSFKFEQVYEPTDMTFTLYEINGNKYAFYQTFNVRVYPNIEFVSKGTILNYTDIAQGDTDDISNYFTLEQYVWSKTEYQTKANEISGLSYSITGVDSNFPVELESTTEPGTTTIKFKKINGKVLNLQYGELDKKFTILISTASGEEAIVIRDYAGNTIEKEMSLVLGYDYDELSKLASNYMQKVRYGGEDVILFKYSAETIDLEASLADISGNTYSFDLVGNENPTLFTKTDVQKFQVTAPTDLIAQGKSYYLPLAMYKDGKASTEEPVAYVRIPLVISQVNSIFAYYDNYNTEKENFDLKTLLIQAENYAELPMDIYSTKSAGASYQIIFENENKYVVAENNNITINGKTYKWKVETSGEPAVTTLTLESTVNSEDKVQATEGQKLIFTTANSVNLNYTWSVSEDNKTLTLIAEGIAEGIYNTASYVSTLSVIAEQKLVKISGSELNNKVAGKDLALKLVNGNKISSSFDKIIIGETSYTWSLDENKKLVLTLPDGHSITENNGTIKIGDEEYTIEYYTLRDVGDSGLIQIANENDNFITIKSLADEERYAIVQMLSSIGNKSYIILYRLRITNDLTITENYPYSGNVEYLDVDGTLTKDLNAKENNVQRFIVKKGEVDADPAPAFTNQIKSIVRNDGTEYTIGGVYSINETITGEERRYTAGGFITIIFKGDKMTIEMSKDEKNVKVVMNRTYTDVVNGVREYTFYLNVSSSEYIIEYKQEAEGIRVEYKGSAEIDLNPAGEQTFTITTLRQIGTTISTVGENVITEIATGNVGTNLTLEQTGDAGTLKRFDLKQSEGTTIATITYDYKEKTLAITPTPEYNFTTETTFALIFTAKETKNEETISIQSGIATLKFTFGRTIKIEENNEPLYGGMTYDFVGDAGLIKKVLEYNSSNKDYDEKAAASYSVSISYKVKVGTEYKDGKIIKIGTKTITTAMLKEDVDVKFDITIEVGGNSYKFTLYRTIKKNVAYVNGTELANDKDNAYTLNPAGQTTAGEDKSINFADYLKLEDASITLPEGTEVTKESQIPLTGTATHYKISWTKDGKEYKTTVPVDDIIYTPAAGGTPEKYTLNKATTLFTTRRGGKFSLEQVNLTTEKTGTDIQDTVGRVAIDASNGDFTITPANVAVAQPCAYAIMVKYTFEDYSYTFYINIRMMVVPNTTATVNYPVIGGTELEYETVGTDDITLAKDVELTIVSSDSTKLSDNSILVKDASDRKFVINKAQVEGADFNANSKVTLKAATTINSFNVDDDDIINNFFKQSSDLSSANRVVFGPVSGSSGVSINTYTASIIKAEDVLWYQNENTVVLTLVNGKSSGTVTFSVICNAVSVEYEVYLIAGDVYTINKHYTVGSIESGTETIDGINRDALATKTIFENDRLIALSIPSSIDTSLNNKIVNVTYNYKEESETKSATVQFKLNTGKRGLTIYLEAGRKVDSIESVMIDGTTTDLKEIWNARTTQRITVSYTTKLAPIEIDKEKITGTVSSTTSSLSGGTAPTGKFESEIADEKYTIQSLDAIDTVYTATFNIKIGNNNNALTEQNYTFQQLFDIDVDYDYRKGDVAITVTAHEVKNLVSLAGIRHPSTGILLNGDNIGNASVALTVLTPEGTVDNSWTGTIQSETALTNSRTYNTYKSLIDATFTKMTDNSIKFLTYTDIKNSNNNIYNYNLYGEGAANAGSFVLLKFTYTVDSSTKDFYIWTRILPDYEVKVDGNSITTEVSDGSTFLSTSENSSNPYEVNINADSEGNTETPAYSFTLTAKGSDSGKVLTIIDRKTNSSDKAINWTYKMTDDEQESSIIYNTNLDKLWLNGSENSNIKSITDFPSDNKNHYLTKEENSIKINQTAENVFGTKKYKIVISNNYGYIANFYFDIKPKNMRDPVIHSSSTLESIAEGDHFDIGAVYDVLTINEEEGNPDKYDIIVETKSSTADNIVNIEGIDAWGFNIDALGSTPLLTDNINSFLSFENYFDSDKMLLRYVTIKQIDFLYGSEKVNVGSLTADSFTNEKLTLATEEYLKLASIDKNRATTAKAITDETKTIQDGVEVTISAGTDEGTYKVTNGETTIDNVTADKLKFNYLTFSNLQSRAYSNANFTIPQLDEWIYSDSALSSTSKDSARVTMRITLNFGKATTAEEITATIPAGVEVTISAGTTAETYKVTYGETTIDNVNASQLNDIQTETYQLTKEITVTRKVEIDKSKQAVVRDGVAFELGKAVDSGYYFEAKNGGTTLNTSSTPSTPTFIDDTLAISLPAAQGMVQNLTVGIEVRNTIPANTVVTISAGTTAGTYKVTYGKTTIDNVTADKLNLTNATTAETAEEVVDVKAKGTISVQNSSDKVTTIYRSISSVLTAWKNGQEVKGKGYLIKAGNKLKLTFSNFDNNNYISVGNNQYNKFYVTYGLTTNGDNHNVANTWTIQYKVKQQINYSSDGTYSETTTNPSIAENTNVKIVEWDNDLATIITNDGTTVKNVPKGKLKVGYPTETTTYSLSKDLYYIDGQFSTIGDTSIVKGSSVTIEGYDIQNKTYIIKYNNSITITGVPESYLSCSVQVETTVATQTHDKINIPTSDQFSQTKMPEVEKSYIVTVDMESSYSYRVVKNWIVTPYYYRATDGVSYGKDESEFINVYVNKAITAKEIKATIPAGTEVTIPEGTEVTISEGTAGTYNVTSEAITINNVSADKLKYQVELSAWAKNIKVAEGKGATNAPEYKNTDINIDATYLNIMIGNPGQAGTATINPDDGSVTTRAGYPLGGVEYILLVIKVRASGIDGLFSVANNTDYELGNLRLFVSAAS